MPTVCLWALQSLFCGMLTASHEVGYPSDFTDEELESQRNEITGQGYPADMWQSCLPLLGDLAASRAWGFSPQMPMAITKQ